MTYTFGGTLTQTFGPNGPAASISAIVVTAIGSSLLSMVLSTLGHGTAANIVKAVSTLVCIGILVAAVTKTLSTLGISL